MYHKVLNMSLKLSSFPQKFTAQEKKFFIKDFSILCAKIADWFLGALF